MAVFNGERYLADAVESILHQSFRDFEFLILNDGSTDGPGRFYERSRRVIHAFGCSSKSDAD